MRMTAPRTARNAVIAAVATAMAATALPAAAAPFSAVAGQDLATQSSLPIVQVRNGRNAAVFGAIAGVTALGIGAALASRNRYDNGYGAGYAPGYGQGYAQGYAPGYAPGGYYEQPGPAYGYYGAPVAVEEPSYGYYEPAPVYGRPRYYEEPIVTYDNRPARRHHAGGPAKRQIDNFRDSYR